MDFERNNSVILIAGNRGTGKTEFEKSLVKASLLPKQLIVDTFYSPVWFNMETWDDPAGKNTPVNVMQIEDLPQWKNGLYLLYNSDTDLIMEAVQTYMRNTFAVFEDATKYIGRKLTKPVRKFVLDSKQKNNDLVFPFHSLADIPRDLVRISDYLTVCKTGEQFDNNLRKKFPPCVEIAHKKVMASPDPYAKITVRISG